MVLLTKGRVMRILSKTLLLLITLLIYGCGPMYETTYHYRLPKNRSDRHCIAQCRMSLGICHNSCQQSQQICQNQQLMAEDIASRHRHRHDDDFFYAPGNCAQACGCRRAFNYCYTDCGGKVIPESVCVFNCPSQQAN